MDKASRVYLNVDNARFSLLIKKTMLNNETIWLKWKNYPMFPLYYLSIGAIIVYIHHFNDAGLQPAG